MRRTPGVPDLMRAVRLGGFGAPETLTMTELPVPPPAAGEVLVKVAACGVCGQDVMRRTGQLGPDRGVIIGHEVAGTVVAVGDAVQGLEVGDRVAALQRRACGACHECRAGRPVLCESGRLYGEDVDGGYADYAAIAETSLARVPDGVELAAAAIAACAIGTSLHALRLAGAQAGQRVLVTGAGGGLGIHALELVRAVGATSVAVTSTPGRATQLADLADDVVVIDGDGRFDREVRRRRIRPHIVLDLSARYTLSESLRTVRSGGTVVIVGNLGAGPVEVLPGAFIVRELRLIGSKATSLDELETVLDLLARDRIRAHVGESLSLEQAARAHALVERKAVRGRVVLVP